MKRLRFLTLMFAVVLALSGCARGNEMKEETGTDTNEGTADLTQETLNPAQTEPMTDVETEPDTPKTYAAFTWEEGTKCLIRDNAWAARVYVLPDGSVMGAYESGDGIHTRISDDLGQTWRDDVTASFVPGRSCANINLYFHEGLLYMAYRAVGPDPLGYYTSLRVSVSEDCGKSWRGHSLIIENYEPDHEYRGVWEPCLGVIDGTLTCFFANDSSSVTKMQNIEAVTWDGESWTNHRVISCGEDHNSRDGMPVWISLRDGGYALVIESSYRLGRGIPFIIQLLYSPDGIEWGKPQDVYIPRAKTSMAGAPGIVELPDGRIVVSFQTDEDCDSKGVSYCVMKTVVSDGTPCRMLGRGNYSAAENVFGTPAGQPSVWTGITFANGRLYAAGGTSAGAEMKYIVISE